MQNLTQIAEEVLLLNPGDAAAKNIASMLDSFSKQDGIADSVRKSAQEACKLAKKLATKKATPEDLQALLTLLTKMEQQESEAEAGSTVTTQLVAEYLISQDSVLEEFEEMAMELAAKGEDGLRSLRRQVHTWKGEMGIIGAEHLVKVLHAIEDALDEISPEHYQSVSDAMLDLKDGMSECFRALREQRKPELDGDKIMSLLKAEAAPAPAPASPAAHMVTFEDPPLTPVSSAEGENRRLPFERRKAVLPDTVDGYFVIQEGVDTELVGEFAAEADEHFQNIETGLMTLETEPDDLDSVNNVFRAFHTVKGVASFVGVNYITELAHKAENLLDRVRKGTLTLEGPFVDMAFESMDLLRKMIQSLSGAISEGKYPVPGNYAGLLYRLEHPEEVMEDFRAKGGVSKPVVIDDDDSLSAEQADSAANDPTENSQEEQTSSSEQKSVQSSGAGTPPPTADATVKVNMSRLDSLINMVGELVIAQAMVGQDPDIALSNNRKLVQNVAQLAKITRSLQELALSMRMVSVKPTFQKMARLVRDVARKSGKNVEFEMAGEDTELDRNMVEAIADPLVHMVRNAVDHGVEPSEDRAKAGKSSQGLVHLSAAHEGGSVLITLRDDGRGLNRERILAKAIERGIVDQNQQLSDKEIYNLIFLPGFSTAEKITDVSGRGVGMDVVRTNIEKLRGSVEIDSTPGKGSVFRIRLPLTLAIIDGMVIKTGSQKFIIPTIAITESFRPLPQDIVTVHGRGEMVQLRGTLLPVCRLHSAFQVNDAGTALADSILVVAEAKNKRVAIMADGLLGQQQVVIKALGKLFDGMEGVAGCAILGDGHISLILDVEGVMNVCQNSHSDCYSVVEDEVTA
ncbi:MAG: chemotaxis protein CheA [Calditrichaeota bacterium]|nr:chemotaxis protein CheA [Calditrichota bacterium]MCB9369112.1 chemotaxis protein CheA [Calditrichota bacterium]